MTDSDRLQKLEDEVEDLKAKLDYLLRQSGFNEAELVHFRKFSTIPAPPPDGVEHLSDGPVVEDPSER